MFNWLPKKSAESQQSNTESVEDDYQTHLTFYTLPDGGGDIFLDAIMEPTTESVSEMVRIIANMFSVQTQANTMMVIRENLLKSGRNDLAKHFEEELIVAALNKPSIDTETGEEEPCVSPSELIT